MTKQHVIIFDGPDGCGKTQMSQALANELEIPYFKNCDEHRYFLQDPSYFLHAVRYVDTYFTSFLEQSGASVILDRAWPSEWIYGSVLGRKVDFEVLRELDSRHARLGTKIIVPVRSNYENSSDEYEAINDNIEKIHERYLEFAEWSKCDVLVMNVDDENLERELSDIKQFLEK
jgi:thymidylate kinase